MCVHAYVKQRTGERESSIVTIEGCAEQEALGTRRHAQKVFRIEGLVLRAARGRYGKGSHLGVGGKGV